MAEEGCGATFWITGAALIAEKMSVPYDATIARCAYLLAALRRRVADVERLRLFVDRFGRRDVPRLRLRFFVDRFGRREERLDELRRRLRGIGMFAS